MPDGISNFLLFLFEKILVYHSSPCDFLVKKCNAYRLEFRNMSHASSKKSVFDRIGGNSSSTTTNVANKSVCEQFNCLLFFTIEKKHQYFFRHMAFVMHLSKMDHVH